MKLPNYRLNECFYLKHQETCPRPLIHNVWTFKCFYCDIEQAASEPTKPNMSNALKHFRVFANIQTLSHPMT